MVTLWDMTLAYWGFSRLAHSPSKVRLQILIKEMTIQDKQRCMYVGIDVHKDTHTAVGISPFGEKLFEITVGNYKQDFENLIEKVDQEKGSLSPYFGLEDVRGYGERLAEFLHSKYPVIHVPSILVDRQRQNETHPEKSDSLDALGVAKVMITRIDTLPIYTISEEAEKAKQIKELSMDREYLVEERTRLKNHLHNLLHRIWNSEYQGKFKDPFTLKALRFWLKAKPKCDPFLLRSMKRKVRRLLDIYYEILDLEKEMEILLNANYTIHTASGCGTTIAGMIVGEIGDINRFHSPGALAKYAGCAPRECSSGKKQRHRKTRSGNRRLNCAFHRMALSQISRSGNDRAREYFKRKVSEGKSKSQALVCLRRQMVNIVWMMMKHRTVYRNA
jgi:transposase